MKTTKKINVNVFYYQIRSDNFSVTPIPDEDVVDTAWRKAEQLCEAGWEIDRIEVVGEED